MISDEFKPLFDGKTLTGWHAIPRYQWPSRPGSPLAEIHRTSCGTWKAEDGMIVGGQDARRIIHPKTGEDWGFGGYLVTDETYGDFELQLEANPEWPCDTGIYVRCTETAEAFQILLDHRGDDENGVGGSIGFYYFNGIGRIKVDPYNFRWSVGPDGRPNAVRFVPARTGVTALNYAATGEEFRRAWNLNGWNSFRIRVTGGLPCITVWINDIKISECDTARVQHPDYQPGQARKILGAKGAIGLEVHDGPPWRWGIGKVVRWRNIFVRPL